MPPYSGEHSCRLLEPIKGANTKRVNGEREHEGKKYDVIYQEQKNGDWDEQAYRYPKEVWTSSSARSHCKSHDGILFEPASGRGDEMMDFEFRSAIGSHHTDTTDVAWDAGANTKKVKKDQPASYYAKVYAWKDPDGDVGNKGSYKFPHHMVSADGTPGAANTRACSNCVAVLNGGRGGADIPDSDRRGVHRHVGTHLKDAGKEVPELKSDSDDELERRFVSITDAELRADTVEDKPMIVGYAARFNNWGGDEHAFLEMIQPGAFLKTIAKTDVRCLFNHDSNYLLGRKSSGTLRLWEDSIGLYMEVDVNMDDPQAMAVFSKIKRRDVTGQSFSFYNPKDVWDFTDEETPKRTLVEVDLVDIGPVTFPFYEVTSAEPAYRSLTRAREALKTVNDSGLVIPRLDMLQAKLQRDEHFRRLKGAQ